MKKSLLVLALAVSAFTYSAKAQFISPSADDFEVWSADIANSSAMDPNSGAGSVGWQSLNILSGSLTGNSPVSCFQESSIVHSGSYSCKVVSVPLSSTSYAYVKGFLPHDTCGIVAVGELSTFPVGLKLGAPHSQRITSAPKFWFQYMPQVGNGKPDTAFCTITLSHYSSGKRNILGGGYAQMKAASSWTLDSIPIYYDSLSGNPDTVQVFFSSSSLFAPVPGSTLYLDGISTVTGVNNIIAPTASVNVYPNPATTQVNFSVTGNDMASQADIYDITGQKIHSYQFKNSLSSINTSNYNVGLYFYKLYDKEGNQLKMGKFTVTR